MVISTSVYSQTKPKVKPKPKPQAPLVVLSHQDSVRLDSLEYVRIIKLNVNTLLKEYGQEKGMQLIRKYMLVQVNEKRKERGLVLYALNDTLNQTAQSLRSS